MYISDHAYERAKERLGLSKKAIERMFSIALEKGLYQKHFSGKMKRYIDSLSMNEHGSAKVRIYGQYVFIIGRKDSLITILNLPNEFKKIVKDIATE